MSSDERKNIDWNKVILKVDNNSNTFGNILQTIVKYCILIGAIYLFFFLFGAKIGDKFDNFLSIFHQNKLVSDLQRRLDEQARTFKKFQDESVRANVKMVSSLKSELEKLQKTNQEMYNDLMKTKAELQTTMNLLAQNSAALSRDLRTGFDIHKGKIGSENEYYMKYIYMRKKDPKTKKVVQIPIAWVMYYPNRPIGKRWKVGMDQIAVKADIYRAKQVSGGFQDYAKIYIENTRSKKYRGVKVPLSIQEFNVKEVWPKRKRFFWWNPTFGMGFNVNSHSYLGAGLTFSPMSYGLTKDSSDWKFLSLHLYGGDDSFGIGIAPFSWNIKGLTHGVTKHTYLSPLFSFDVNDADETSLTFGLLVDSDF